MEKIFLQILMVAYASAGIIGKIGYWPTIKDLYHKKPSANINTYALWTLTSGTVFLYAVFVVNDLLFKFVAWLDFTSCFVILVLSINLKYRECLKAKYIKVLNSLYLKKS